MSNNEFPWYCSLGPLGYATCPDRSKPWYCYMGALGRTQCANDEHIPQDPITNTMNGIGDAAGAAGNVISNIDLILKLAAFGGAALLILYAAKTVKDITH